MGPNYPSWVRYLSASFIVAAGGLACFIGFNAYMDENAEKALGSSNMELSEQIGACIADQGCISPTYLVQLAAKIQQSEDADKTAALTLLNRAVEQAPYNGTAWTRIAELEAENAGGMSPDAANALRMSIEACWLCDDQDLLRDRLKLVLVHWSTTPEDIRIAAFEGAELLRWKYEDEDFLAEQDDYAIMKDVPFDTYMAQMAATPKIEQSAP